MEHFSETLNRDVPINPVEEDGGEDQKEIEERSRKMASSRGLECFEDDKGRESSGSR